MRKHLLFLLLPFLFQSCWNWGAVDDDSYGSIYEPITFLRADFETGIRLKEPRPIIDAGKIYIKDHLIYLNEKEAGFHIFNNTDPKNPKPLAFIELPLATDLAIRGNVVYAHHAVDLVSFTYSVSTNDLQVLHRERDVFPTLRSPDGFYADFFDVPEDHIIIGYELKTN